MAQSAAADNFNTTMADSHRCWHLEFGNQTNQLINHMLMLVEPCVSCNLAEATVLSAVLVQDPIVPASHHDKSGLA